MFKIDPRFRLASVESYNVNTVLFSSVLQFGDAFSINAESNALALQEEGNILAVPNRDVFEIYPIYKVIPKHLPYVPNVNLNRINLNPTIQIGLINYMGISSASASVIGSVHSASMLSRVHQVRHFISPITIHYQTPGHHAQPTFSQLMQPLTTTSTQIIPAQPVIPVPPVASVQPVLPTARTQKTETPETIIPD
ncbi:spore germination protein GerPE [Gottfriedia acidiceleris]|uniref:Spore germination protein GerPE n=1 Tax=Gottfriedia acidiceleris TaxID=371036 RepID=A0ABY4JI16_9BACI|nr:spore germination protein GerPE [Gottfriedia acidiceleris]UPM53471.1 spore germination protein GerPE [Gottfriedia acidiceleris]